MLPDVVDKTMRKLCNLLNNRLSDSIKAVYIYGSTALGDYIEGSSDIDFIVIVRYPLNSSDVQLIAEAHEVVEEEMPGTDIMGAYIHEEDLGKSFSEIPSLLTYYNKQVHIDGKGADINPITWWVLRNHGILVQGSEIPLSYEITVESLLEYVIGNMNSYWTGWIERLEKQLLLTESSELAIQINQQDDAVEWCVLGMLRQLYTINEHGVTSKTGAGSYGIKIFPARWSGLIREAIAIKRCQPERVYNSQKNRLTDLVALLKLIHIESNRKYFAAYNNILIVERPPR